MDHQIRVLDIEGIRTAVDWARREGWNPGLHDAQAFASADPEGFLGMYVSGELAATISLVSYAPSFAFLGFYICRPELRGQGIGLRLWNAALARRPALTIGLDGVTAQQANYEKSGFSLAHENIRHGGINLAGSGRSHPSLRVLTSADAAAVDRFEQRHLLFPASRAGFLLKWLQHHGLALMRDGEVAGYGVIRECFQGWKIGPLFAANADDAETILRGLLVKAPGQMIFLDTPGTNQAAADLANSFELKPVFSTARMYKGPAPALDTARIFAITTFELG
jgi:GNAT superfamily N-acetyltransferase